MSLLSCQGTCLGKQINSTRKHGKPHSLIHNNQKLYMNRAAVSTTMFIAIHQRCKHEICTHYITYFGLSVPLKTTKIIIIETTSKRPRLPATLLTMETGKKNTQPSQPISWLILTKIKNEFTNKTKWKWGWFSGCLRHLERSRIDLFYSLRGPQRGSLFITALYVNAAVKTYCAAYRCTINDWKYTCK